jgi:hypothetical protein
MKTFTALMLLIWELASAIMAADSVQSLVPTGTPSEPAVAPPRSGTGLPIVGLREIYLSAWEAGELWATNGTGLEESDFLPWLGPKGHAVGEARSPGGTGTGSESSSSGAQLLLSVVNPRESETQSGQGRGRQTSSRPVLPSVGSGQSQIVEPASAGSQQVLVLSNRIMELQVRLQELERQMKEVRLPRSGKGKSQLVPRTPHDVPPKH